MRRRTLSDTVKYTRRQDPPAKGTTARLLSRSFFVTTVLIFTLLGPLPRGAAENLPEPPAVLLFHGGKGDFKVGAGEFGHWGGGTDEKSTPEGKGYDARCEGLVRQTLGLLDDTGRPLEVPADNRLEVGGKVVGLTGNGYKAYNLDVFEFRKALNAASGGSLYSCGHGSEGEISLDESVYFQGFRIPDTGEGTEVERKRFAKGTFPDRPVGAYGELNPPPGHVNVSLHHCYSGRVPEAGHPKAYSVAENLEALKNVTVVHSHQNCSIVGIDYELLGPKTALPTEEETKAEQDRVKAAIDAIVASTTKFPLFPVFYSEVEKAVEQASRPGEYKVKLLFSDKGDELCTTICLDPTSRIGEGESGPCADTGCVEPPTCAVTGLRGGPPKQQDVTVQDTGGGLAFVSNVSISNGTVSINGTRIDSVSSTAALAMSPFEVGTTSPVVLTATKSNQNERTVWSFDATDMAGTVRHCE